MERVLNDLVNRLKKTYGERLSSVILYGSAAVGDHHGRFSDINILCVLTRVTPRELAESAKVFRWWRDQGNPSPLLLSREEVRTSTDCFPIEFHDIRERRRVLYGEDAIAGLEIDNSFYRAQVEHELRAKLLRLRQKAAGMLDQKDLLRTLLSDSIGTFCTLFRHALALAGHEAKFEKREVVAQVRGELAIDTTAFENVLDFREERIKPRDLEPGPVFDAYLNAIQAVIDFVDRLEK